MCYRCAMSDNGVEHELPAANSDEQRRCGTQDGESSEDGTVLERMDCLQLDCSQRADGVDVYEVEICPAPADAVGLHVVLDFNVEILADVRLKYRSALLCTFLAVVDTAVAGALPAAGASWFPALLGQGEQDYVSPRLGDERRSHGVIYATALGKMAHGLVRRSAYLPRSAALYDALGKASVKVVVCIVHCLRGKQNATLSITRSTCWV
jgi:hypothetical protein